MADREKRIELKDCRKETNEEKALRLGNDEVIAKAIQTILRKDKLS